MFPYIYHIDWYDWNEEKQESILITSHGIVSADNFPEAVRRMCDFFGEENILKFSIQAIGEGTENILELTEEQAKYFETEFT